MNMNNTLSIHSLCVGFLAVNCYILARENSHEAIVIDPGGDGDRILALAKKLGLHPSFVLNTHGHFDHIGANVFLRENTKAKIGIHLKDAPFLGGEILCGAQALGFPFTPHHPDFTFMDGDILDLDDISIRVIHTPGHTPGGSCFFVDQTEEAPLLFSGDTLFCGSVGRTDLPGGDFKILEKSLKKLKQIILPETIILPGHGSQTTMKEELENNPFL